MTSRLTMHQLGDPQAPQGLTSHTMRPRAARTKHGRRSTDKTVPVVADGVTTPKVGTEIDVDLDLVVFEGSAGSVSRTPMTKLRYNEAAKQWQQIGASQAGMLAFFDVEPPDDCTRVRIVRLIPSGRACYVVPV